MEGVLRLFALNDNEWKDPMMQDMEQAGTACPFAGKAANEVETKTKLSSGVAAAWASLALAVVIALVSNAVIVGKLVGKVDGTADDIIELKESTKDIVVILGNQQVFRSEIRYLDQRLKALEAKVEKTN